MSSKKTLSRLYLILTSISGLFLFGYLYSLDQIRKTFISAPTSIQAAVVVGILLYLVLWISSISGIIVSYVIQEKYHRWLNSWAEKLACPRSLSWIIAGFLGLAFIIGNFLFQINLVKLPLFLALLPLFRGILIWLLGNILLLIVLMLVIAGKERILMSREFLRPLMIFLSLIIFGLIISRSGFGYDKTISDGGYFGPTSYPIVGYQVVIALLCLGLFLSLDHYLVKRLGEKYGNYRWLLDAGIIILVAFALWNSVPIKEHEYYDFPQPPNMERYPRLDGEIYDRGAQHYLATGKMGSYLTEDYRAVIARRPLLILIYAGLHRLGGLGFKEIVPYQLALFTAFPLLVYLFTKQISNIAAGLLAALLVIIRGWNGLQLGSSVTGTNLQMIMSDYPAVIGVVLFLYLAVVWLKNSPQNSFLPLIMGGVLGGTMLIRQEVGAMVLPAILVGLVTLRKEPKKIIQGGLSLALGMLLVISPWMARNYQLTGKAYLDAPWSSGFFRQTLNQIKSDSLDDELNPLTIIPAEELAVTHRHRQLVSINPIPISLKDENPGLDPSGHNQVDENNPGVELVANHLVNSTLQTILYLPSRTVIFDFDYLIRAVNKLRKSDYGGVLYKLDEYVRQAPYWSWGWDGQIKRSSILPLGLTLLLIAIGLSCVWKRVNWVVFIPILALFIHIAVYGFIRRSGGRFILQVDWITTSFYCTGLVQVISLLGKGNAVQGEEHVTNLPAGSGLGLSRSWIIYQVIVAGFLLLGAAPVAAENVSPNHYPEELLDQKLASVLEGPGSPWTPEERDLVREFLENGGKAYYGRALYPRYYLPGAEVKSHVASEYTNSTTFYISGTIFDFVILPGEEPAHLPHGADVLVIGCPELGREYSKEICVHCKEVGLDALTVVVYGEDGGGEVLWRDSSQNDPGCPQE